MAVLRIPDQGPDELREPDALREALRPLGVDYASWSPRAPLAEGAPAEAVLAAYAGEVEALKRQGGYVTADVIELRPDTPGLDELLARFRREHWHDEDEVRFVIEGRGVFHLRAPDGPVLAVEVGPGDLLRVPRGTWHWFELCSERRIRCIRLFQDPAGWTPHYTGSGVDQGYQPLCLRELPPR